MTDITVDLSNGRVDAALRYGTGQYPQAIAERILEETVTPVCSPDYQARMGGLPTIASLSNCRLLHEDRMEANWEQWLALAGKGGISSSRGPAYSHGSMAIEAAIRGEGVALGRSALIAEDIAAGRLVALFPEIRMKAERCYYLVYRAGNQDHPKVCALREWLADEIQEFVTGTR